VRRSASGLPGSRHGRGSSYASGIGDTRQVLEGLGKGLKAARQKPLLMQFASRDHQFIRQPIVKHRGSAVPSAAAFVHWVSSPTVTKVTSGCRPTSLAANAAGSRPLNDLDATSVS
jgi:hypothetical protein